MKCRKCNKPAKVDISVNPYCESCFKHVLDKRIRRSLRVDFNLEKKDKIVLLDDNSCGAGVLKDVLVAALKYHDFKILKRIGKKKYDKIIIPAVLEEYAAAFLKKEFSGGRFKPPGNLVFPLRNVLKDEAETYCKLKKIKFLKKKVEGMEADIVKMLDSIEKKYPGVKYSLLKSVKQIEEL